MSNKQRELFKRPEFEITKSGDKIYFTYHVPHTIVINKKDKISVKYELIRLVQSKTSTYQEVGKKFGIHPTTISSYADKYSKEGMIGLKLDKRGPKKSFKFQPYAKALKKIFKEDRTLSVKAVYERLNVKNGEVSMATVRRQWKSLHEAARELEEKFL